MHKSGQTGQLPSVNMSVGNHCPTAKEDAKNMKKAALDQPTSKCVYNPASMDGWLLSSR